MKIITDSRCTEYSQAGHPERPQRISRTVEHLRQQKDVAITWSEPGTVEEGQLLRAHDPQHLERLKESRDFDADTPAYSKIYDHARRAVGAALEALRAARKGEICFSLMRPPGHHATRNRAMGFCFLNNVAIAVWEALATGVSKVAVYDFDLHHCNGTEAILLDVPNCAVFSIHQYPAYPGTGAHDVRNSHNYPVAPRTARAAHRDIFQKAFQDMKKFKPDLVAVSAGFDAYRKDPLGEEQLEAEDFHWLGQTIRGLGIPAFSLLEGGYSDDLPELILAYLKGLVGQ